MKGNIAEILRSCKKEEEVKSEVAKWLGFQINALGDIDHYSDSILFEFKYDKGFEKKENIAKVLGQVMYYIRKIEDGISTAYITAKIPGWICGIDKNGGFFVETKKFKKFYEDEGEKYDWDLAPSNPCKKLVADIQRRVDGIRVYEFSQEGEAEKFKEEYHNRNSLELGLVIPKNITKDNFYVVFREWDKLFGERVRNGYKSADYFLSDMVEGNTKQIKEGKDNYLIPIGDSTREKRLPHRLYEEFWKGYVKINPSEMGNIQTRKAILGEDFDRRIRGEYYTPLEFARVGLRYLDSVLGKDWLSSGEYRLWDMAAGSGNLELSIPTSCWKYCYLSTIEEEDVKYCSRIFPQATVFQYDYLNDDIDHIGRTDMFTKPKMPQNLVNDLKNDKIKWVILLNPPYKTAQNNSVKTSMKTWDKVSNTSIRRWMGKEDLLETSRELYMQFLFRISKEFEGKNTTLCLYSTIKYMVSNNDQKARDKFLKWTFCKGFMFDAKCFYLAKGGFSVSYAIWKLHEKQPLEQQTISFDVFNEKFEKYGTKHLSLKHRSNLLNKWVPRKRNTQIMVPFSSAFNKVTKEHTDVRDRIAEGFLFSCYSPSDKVEAYRLFNLLSAPNVSAGGFSVVPENFERAMVSHAVKKVIIPTWVNNGEQYYMPTKELPQDFVTDCVVWAAFADSNNAVALKDVEYKGTFYQIQNNLFPFTLEELRTWNVSDCSLAQQIQSANEDRFLANWLSTRHFSNEAKNLLDSARDLYKTVYGNLPDLDWAAAKIDTWDFGMMQIKVAITNSDIAKKEITSLKSAHRLLGNKLRPMVYEYGFMEEDVVPFETAETSD